MLYIIFFFKQKTTYVSRISDWSSYVCSSDLHRNDQDEGQVLPVGNVDVPLLAPRQGAQIEHQIGHPDNHQPDVGIPLRLGILLGLGDADEVPADRQYAEQVVAEDNQPRTELDQKNIV